MSFTFLKKYYSPPAANAKIQLQIEIHLHHHHQQPYIKQDQEELEQLVESNKIVDVEQEDDEDKED